MIKLFTALAPALCLSGIAVAAEAPTQIRVTLATPVAQAGLVQGLATRWSCAGTTCTGPELNGRFGDARACREAAKVAGVITAYSSARGELDAEALAKCNKSAKHV